MVFLWAWHFSKVFKSGSDYFSGPACLILGHVHKVFKSCMWYQFLTYDWVAFHSKYISHFLYPFSQKWTFGLYRSAKIYSQILHTELPLVYVRRVVSSNLNWTWFSILYLQQLKRWTSYMKAKLWMQNETPHFLATLRFLLSLWLSKGIGSQILLYYRITKKDRYQGCSCTPTQVNQWLGWFSSSIII